MNKARSGFRSRAGMFLIAVGVVYGDIGTSPMYVMKSIISGNGGIAGVDNEFVTGSLSLVIWTVTLLTTLKYVLFAMKADNHGEGGIFSLYSLVRKYGRYLIWPAMIGGSALLADGMLTPAVTVTTAVEGLRSIPGFGEAFSETGVVLVLTLLIIAILFLSQHLGTSTIGNVFGPVMMLWFLFLAAAGTVCLLAEPSVLHALNPLCALQVLFSEKNKEGFMILGSVFLATTGAEALYSDMGHVGKTNIYISWPFVKFCLILNYLGQGAWIIGNQGNAALEGIRDMNPFFLMIPEQLRPFSVVLGALAAVIASQALISGSFTLVSEAIRLDLMPHMQIVYPARTKGQLYIPLVNAALWAGCSAVVLYFRTSARMEAAYGLAITLTMLMTTLLLTIYLLKRRKKRIQAFFALVFFGMLEIMFFISSLSKFFAGGYVAFAAALFLLCIMVIWEKGTRIEEMQQVKLKIRDYIPVLRQLREDPLVQKKCDNMVFITKTADPEYADRDILYSILDRDSKKAAAYWFIHIRVTEEPYTTQYHVETYGTDFVFHVSLYLGFKINQRVNVIIRQIVSDLIRTGELPRQKQRYSIYQQTEVGNFRFCLIRKTLIPESELTAMESTAISLKYAVRRLAGSPAKWYGLENSSLIIEYVPLFISEKVMRPLERV